jgi:hypothetical protein
MDNFSRTQIIRKAVIPTRGGVVATKALGRLAPSSG